MKLIDETREVKVEYTPLLEDLLIGWGHRESDIKAAKEEDASLIVKDVDTLTCELSAWGIPWKRINWKY